jgi:hypothetical protein
MITDSAAAGPPPTPYPDVNVVLSDFQISIGSILGNRFLAMYLSGSLALGDFAHERSDIDFVVVTDSELSNDHFSSLQAMHTRFNTSDSPWAGEVEAVYIPKASMPRHDPTRSRHPHIQRGPDNILEMDQLASDWIVQRHILREHGIVMVGPAPRSVIEPVQPDDMRRAVIDLIKEWWGSIGDDPAPLRRRGYQVYAVQTMCRVLYTLERGDVVSKPVAARWARKELDDRWSGLIERSLAWTKDLQQTADGDVERTRELIQLTVERCTQWESRAAPLTG